MNKGKGKAHVYEYVMKKYREKEEWLHALLTLKLDRGERLDSLPSFLHVG
jgi:hypothetical protein